ncbi:MAG: hypothetical protein R2865_10235 [Deinococcales bacterium]
MRHKLEDQGGLYKLFKDTIQQNWVLCKRLQNADKAFKMRFIFKVYDEG